LVVLRDPRDVVISEFYHAHSDDAHQYDRNPKLIQHITNHFKTACRWTAARYLWHSQKLANHSVIFQYEDVWQPERRPHFIQYLCRELLARNCSEPEVAHVLYHSSSSGAQADYKLAHGETNAMVRSAGNTTWRDHASAREMSAHMNNVMKETLPVELLRAWTANPPPVDAALGGWRDRDRLLDFV
jgi:hypothetical protein